MARKGEVSGDTVHENETKGGEVDVDMESEEELDPELLKRGELEG